MTVLFCVLLVAMLLAGPFRRPFLRHWRFTFPALIGLVAGWLVFHRVAAHWGYGWLFPAAVLVFALWTGLDGKEWLERHFPERKE